MEINKLETPSEKDAKTLFKLAVKNQKNSTYYRRKKARRERIRQAKRKYGVMLLLLLILPSLFIGYSAYQLTEDLKAVQEDITAPSPVYEAIKAQNEDLKQENEILARYDKELASLGSMGQAIKNAGEEFGQDAEEAVKLQGLMIGIANAESSLGKKYHVAYDANCHNWWGLKGGNMEKREDGSYLRCFISDEAGARTMAKTLKLYYLNEGKDTPEKIVVKYVGASWGQYHDAWVANVKKYAR